MVRIFLPLAGLSTITLVTAMVFGLAIDDPRVPDRAVQAGVQYHFLIALAALMFTTLVHAIVLTYFMGTGRWLEEVSSAYQLPPDFHAKSKSTKYRTVLAIVACFLLLITTGALGAAADPASPIQSRGLFGLPASTVHLIAALVALVANLVTFVVEFRALERNGEIVDAVQAEVRRIRLAKGLAV